MTEESNIIVLRSTYDKTPTISYRIAPCKDPKTGRYPDCVRKVNAAGDMILSEDDIKKQSAGKAIFIPENTPIRVQHGTTFDLSDLLQAAQWEAIKNSKLIAKEIDAKDELGRSLIEGGKSVIDRYGNAKGTYGIAELFIERPGKMAKVKNDLRKLIHQAETLIFNDDLSHRILISKLFGKDFEHTNPNDIEDFLLTKAQKEPQRVIDYYDVEKSGTRLLLIAALEKGVVNKRPDGLYFAEIRIGANLDLACSYIGNPSNKELREQIKSETYPDLKKK